MNDFKIDDLKPEETLTYRHEFAAAPRQVFEAFTNPTLFIKWFGPADWKIIPNTLTLEPVIGGRKQFVMRHKDQAKFQAPMYLRFVTLAEPHTIEYREALPTPSGQPSDTLIGLRLEFEAGTAVTEDGVGEGTILKLTQGPLPAGVHEQTLASWQGSFGKLAELLKQA